MSPAQTAPTAAPPKLLRPSELSFDTLCNLFEFLTKPEKAKRKSFAVRRQIWERFLKTCVWRESRDAFSLFRLVLPALDEERGNMRLLEGALSNVMLRACALDRKGEAARALKSWKRPGVKGVGVYAEVLQQYIFSTFCDKVADTAEAKTLKIAGVNQALDELVKHAGKSELQAKILRTLMSQTTPRQMFWLTQIILKRLKIGTSEATIFELWHPDATAYFNRCGSRIRAVFDDLVDPRSRVDTHVRVGAPVRPQLALGTGSAAVALQNVLKGEHVDGAGASQICGTETEKPLAAASASCSPLSAPPNPLPGQFAIELKLDGERMQVHLHEDGRVQYFSRRGIEHGVKSQYAVLNESVRRSVSAASCILDGELVVWNWAKEQFEPFGGLKSVLKSVAKARGKGWSEASSEGQETLQPSQATQSTLSQPEELEDDDLVPSLSASELATLCVVFVCFDMLLVNGESLVELPWTERQARLRSCVVDWGSGGCWDVNLSAETGSNSRSPNFSCSTAVLHPTSAQARVVALVPQVTRFGEHWASTFGSSEADISRAVAAARRRGEEGVVLKSVTSPWVVNDRSGAWIKIKPDYVHRLDIDAVVLGGWYGSGRRSQRLSQYLLGLRVGGKREEATEAADDACVRDSRDCNSQFITFCRVGGGLSDDERAELNEALRPFLQDVLAEADGELGSLSGVPPAGSLPPDCLTLTGRERPDAWVRDLQQSVVVEVHADLRAVASSTFATDMGLRFPRLGSVRWDKGPAQATTLLELRGRLEEQRARQRGEEEEDKGGGPRKRRGVQEGVGGRKGKERRRVVGSLRAPCLESEENLGEAAAKAKVLQGALVFLASVGPHDKRAVERAVLRAGGSLSQNYVPSVGRVLGHSAGDLGCRRVIARDVSVLDVGLALEDVGRLAMDGAGLRPRDFVYMSTPALHGQGTASRLGDLSDAALEPADVEALLHRHIRVRLLDVRELAGAVAGEEAARAGGERGEKAAGAEEHDKERLRLFVSEELARSGRQPLWEEPLRAERVCVLDVGAEAGPPETALDRAMRVHRQIRKRRLELAARAAGASLVSLDSPQLTSLVVDDLGGAEGAAAAAIRALAAQATRRRLGTLKAKLVVGSVVAREPNWLDLCPKTAALPPADATRDFPVHPRDWSWPALSASPEASEEEQEEEVAAPQRPRRRPARAASGSSPAARRRGTSGRATRFRRQRAEESAEEAEDAKGAKSPKGEAPVEEGQRRLVAAAVPVEPEQEPLPTPPAPPEHDQAQTMLHRSLQADSVIVESLDEEPKAAIEPAALTPSDAPELPPPPPQKLSIRERAARLGLGIS